MSQIIKKYIANGAIDGDKLKLLVGQAIKIEDGNGGTIDLIKINNAGKVVVKGDVVAVKGDVDGLDARIAVLEQDPTTKTYVDQEVMGAINTAEGYADGLLVTAQSYADTKKAEAISEAESYADGLLITAQSYADTKKSEAISAAEGYVDGKIADLINGAPTALDTLKEIADQLANDESAVGALTTTVANNLQTAKDYADAAVLVEHNARITAVNGAIATAEGYADAAVLVEKNRAETAEGLLDGRLDVLEGADTVVGSVAKALKDAKAYADAAVAVEVSARQTAVTGAISTAEGYADTKKAEAQSYADGIVATEATTRANADTALSNRISALEGGSANKTWAKEKFVLSTQLGYVDLAHVVDVNSLVVAVGPLMMHITDDFTTSTVSSKTRLTFVNDFASGGVEAMAANDVVYVTYQY